MVVNGPCSLSCTSCPFVYACSLLTVFHLVPQTYFCQPYCPFTLILPLACLSILIFTFCAACPPFTPPSLGQSDPYMLLSFMNLLTRRISYSSCFLPSVLPRLQSHEISLILINSPLIMLVAFGSSLCGKKKNIYGFAKFNLS